MNKFKVGDWVRIKESTWERVFKEHGKRPGRLKVTGIIDSFVYIDTRNILPWRGVTSWYSYELEIFNYCKLCRR